MRVMPIFKSYQLCDPYDLNEVYEDIKNLGLDYPSTVISLGKKVKDFSTDMTNVCTHGEYITFAMPLTKAHTAFFLRHPCVEEQRLEETYTHED